MSFRLKLTGRRYALAATSILLGFVVLRGAAALDDVVIERQRDMKEMARSAKVISDMFKTPESYSARVFKSVAESISLRSGDRLVAHFAASTVIEGSKATEAIANDRERFAALARDLKTYADAIASSADQHPDKLSDDMRMKPGEPMGGGPLGTHVRNEAKLSSMSAEHAFHLMLQTCTTCHSRFRKSE